VDLPFSYTPDTRHAGPRIFVETGSRLHAFSGLQDTIVADARRLVVLVEIGLERERLSTALARVQLERRVRLHVGAQVGPVGERLAAVGAAERLLAGV